MMIYAIYCRNMEYIVSGYIGMEHKEGGGKRETGRGGRKGGRDGGGREGGGRVKKGVTRDLHLREISLHNFGKIKATL